MQKLINSINEQSKVLHLTTKTNSNQLKLIFKASTIMKKNVYMISFPFNKNSIASLKSDARWHWKLNLNLILVIALTFAQLTSHAQATLLGSNFTGAHGSYMTRIEVFNDNPYVAYTDNSITQTNIPVWLKWWDGTSWNSSSSSAGMAYPFSNAIVMDMKVTSAGIPIVAFADGNANGNVTVRKYESGTWTTLGTTGFSAGPVTELTMALDENDIPCVGFRDAVNGGGATIMKWNGTNWDNVGSPNLGGESSFETRIVFDGSNTPFVCYITGGNVIKAFSFNGTSWVQFGGGPVGTGYSPQQMSYDAFNNRIIVAFQDLNSNDVVYKCDISGGTWTQISLTGFSNGTSAITGLQCKNGNIYLGQYYINDAISIQKFDGSAWSTFNSYTTGATYNPRYSQDFALGADEAIYYSYALQTKEGKVVKLPGASSIQILRSGTEINNPDIVGSAVYGDNFQYTIKNVGGSSMTITSVTGTGGVVLDLTGLATTLSPGSTTTFIARPKYTSNHEISIISNAANYPVFSFYLQSIVSSKPVTITGIVVPNKVYDGNIEATVSGGEISEVVADDILTLNGGSTSFSDKNVGDGKVVSFSGFFISGSNASYYTLSQPANTTANITAKELTITSVTASSKIYDGTTSATISGTAVLNGLITGDDVTLGAGVVVGQFADANAGSGKTVTVSGYTISGADANNYAVSQPILTADITKANQTITFNTLTPKTQGDAAFTLEATSSSNLPVTYVITSGPATVSGNTVTLTGAGTVSVKASQPGNVNYNSATDVTQSFCSNPAKPVITISLPNTEQPVLTSSSTIGNQWYLDGTSVSNATNATFNVTQAGSYSVKVTIEECSSVMSDAKAMIVTGVESNDSRLGVVCYPNPAVNEITIHYNNSRDIQELKITDLSGRVMQAGGSELINVPVSVVNYGGGIYLVHIKAGNRLLTGKFIKN